MSAFGCINKGPINLTRATHRSACKLPPITGNLTPATEGAARKSTIHQSEAIFLWPLMAHLSKLLPILFDQSIHSNQTSAGVFWHGVGQILI